MVFIQYDCRALASSKIPSPEYVKADICALPKTRGKHKVQTMAKKTSDTGPISTRKPQLKATVGALQLSPSTGAVRLLLRLCLLYQGLQLLLLLKNLEKIEQERHVVMLPPQILRFPLL